MFRIHALLACVFTSLACSTGFYHFAKSLAFPPGSVTKTLPSAKVTQRDPSNRFLAGVGIADITPSPGYPTGGHGPAGNLARGHWLRLHARAFYFEEANTGAKAVLVSCDLYQIPGGLFEAVARQAAALGIPPESLFLSATHTHQGPGNFGSASTYNQFGSNYPGFDSDLFDFLADGVFAAIKQAQGNAVGDIQLNLKVGAGRPELTKNRGPLAFLLNWDRDKIMEDLNGKPGDIECKRTTSPTGVPEPEVGWEPSQGCPRVRAVNRRITVLEVDHIDGGVTRPLGALAFFAAHPTVLIHDAPVYDSDFVGYAVSLLERQLSQANKPPVVVGFFNGPEGDISARRWDRDVRDVRRLGQFFAADVQQTIDHPTWSKRLSLKVSARRDEGPDIATSSTESEAAAGSSSPCAWSPSEIRLAAFPQYGTAGLGGGEGDESLLEDLGWRAGIRDRAVDGQGPKLPGLDSTLLRDARFTKDFAPPKSFPSRLPVSWVDIGEMSIAGLPAEITTAMEFEIRQRLQRTDPQFVIAGLTNEYVSYVVTPAEYPAQDYMSASTIWGPHEGPYLGCRLDRLRKQPTTTTTSLPSFRFNPGPKPQTPFGPAFVGDRRAALDDELEKVLRDAAGRPERLLPQFEWKEPAPPAGCPSDLKCVANRHLVILERQSNKWSPRAADFGTDDDGGLQLVILVADHSPQEMTYGGIWLAPLWDNPTGRYAFKAITPGGEVCSRDFTVADIQQSPPAPLPPLPKCSDLP